MVSAGSRTEEVVARSANKLGFLHADFCVESDAARARALVPLIVHLMVCCSALSTSIESKQCENTMAMHGACVASARRQEFCCATSNTYVRTKVEGLLSAMAGLRFAGHGARQPSGRARHAYNVLERPSSFDGTRSSKPLEYVHHAISRK